jgi:hypothetical protein
VKNLLEPDASESNAVITMSVAFNPDTVAVPVLELPEPGRRLIIPDAICDRPRLTVPGPVGIVTTESNEPGTTAPNPPTGVLSGLVVGVMTVKAIGFSPNELMNTQNL